MADINLAIRSRWSISARVLAFRICSAKSATTSGVIVRMSGLTEGSVFFLRAISVNTQKMPICGYLLPSRMLYGSAGKSSVARRRLRSGWRSGTQHPASRSLHFPSVTTGFRFQQFQINFQFRHALFQQHPAAVAELVVKVVLVAVVIIQVDAIRLRTELGTSAVAPPPPQPPPPRPPRAFPSPPPGGSPPARGFWGPR